MEQIKSNLVSFSKKLIIAFIVISIAGLGLLIKPTVSYAGVLFNDGNVYGDSWHKYENIDPQIRPEALASEVPTEGEHEFGRTDTTRYKEDKTHWVQNISFKVMKYAGKRELCVITKNTDSGWFFLDGIDWRYHVVFEDNSGNVSTFWVEGATCNDHVGGIEDFFEPNLCESGNRNIMYEIVDNPEDAVSKGIKMYIDKVWIQD